MLISCEKCSTTYVLDDGLIPPGGAPVQCTKCGNVFTAKPVGIEPELPDATPAPKADSRNQTMMFGVPKAGAAAETAAPSRVPATSTMVFGAPAASQASAPAAKPVLNQTMVFGAVAPMPPVQVVVKASAPNQTMMFGTPASIAAASAAEVAIAAPKLNQTMAFGLAAAAPAPVKAPPPVFGPSGGAVGTEAIDLATSSAAPPSVNQTMMFGLKAPAAAEAPAPAARPVATTSMFGAVAQPAASEPAKPPNTTMMFGKPAAAGPEAALNKTMSFGAPVPGAAALSGPGTPSGPVGRTTMMFGAAVAEPAKPQAMPKVTAGALPVAAKITESTVRVDLGVMMAEGGEQGTANEKTPPDGNFLNREAELETGPSTQGGGPRPERTMLFSMSPGGKPSTNSAPHSRELSSTGEVTLPPESERHSAETSPGLTAVAPGLLSQDLQNHSTEAATGRSNLGNSATLEDVSSEVNAHGEEAIDTLPPGDGDEAGDSAFAALESSTRRRNTIAVIVLLVAVLAAGSAVIWQLAVRQSNAADDNVEKLTPRPVRK